MTMDGDMDHYREDEIATKLAWGELTDEAKGSLLLFHNRGGTIQRWWEGTQSWEDTLLPHWTEAHYYRVKPEHDGKRMFASTMGLSTTPAWTAYQAELEKSKGDKPMTKLEELKAACDAAADAYAARDAAAVYAAAWDAAVDATYDAYAAAYNAYQAELNKTKEQTND